MQSEPAQSLHHCLRMHACLEISLHTYISCHACQSKPEQKHQHLAWVLSYVPTEQLRPGCVSAGPDCGPAGGVPQESWHGKRA